MVHYLEADHLVPAVDHLDVAVAGVVEGARITLPDEDYDAGVGAADASFGGPEANSQLKFDCLDFEQIWVPSLPLASKQIFNQETIKLKMI